jgi:PAS domain S-box-containing protein
VGKGAKSGVDSHTPDLQSLSRQVTERSPLPMAALEGATHLVHYVNPAFCRLVAKKSEELVGIPFVRAMPEAGSMLPHLDQVYRTGEAETCATEEHPLHWSCAMWAVPGASSRPAGVMIQVTDVKEADAFRQRATAMSQELMLSSVRQHERTEAEEELNAELRKEIAVRKSVEKALRAGEEQFRRAIEDAPIPIVMYTEHGEVLQVSNTWTEMTGYAVSDIPTLDEWLKRVYGQGANTLRDQLSLLFEGKQRTVDTELHIRTRDGKSRYWSFSASSPGTLRDSRRFIVGMAQDITDRKLAEQSLQKAHNELEKRVKERTLELQQAYDKLTEETRELEKAEAQLRQAHKMEAVGTLAGGIAHDFNNILAAIIGFSEMAIDKSSEGSPARRHLERIFAAGIRGRELVKQILVFSRQAEPEKEPLKIAPVVKEALVLVRASLPSTVAIRTNLQGSLGFVLADRIQIQQIVLNLCTNAAHAMRRTGGTISIDLDGFSFSSPEDAPDPAMSPGLYARLSVADTGEGMSPEIMEHIFDPFFTTKAAGEGTGLGLSVVHGIVTSYEGHISVSSEPDKGSTFAVYLPKLLEEQSRDSTDEGGSIPRGHERILFIDDEEDLVAMGDEMLTDLGYRITAKTGAREALALFRLNPSRFDLVITDQTMPEMTGEELVKEILVLRADTPIIMCTGFSYLVDADTARAAGIKAFAMKPLTKKEMAMAIRKVLDEHVQ